MDPIHAIQLTRKTASLAMLPSAAPGPREFGAVYMEPQDLFFIHLPDGQAWAQHARAQGAKRRRAALVAIWKSTQHTTGRSGRDA